MPEPVVAPPHPFEVCGVRIDPYTLASATTELIRSPGRRGVDAGTGRSAGCAVHLCNAYTLSLAAKDPAYRWRLNAGDLNLPDGMPLVWLGRRLGLDVHQRVYGPDLMRSTIDHGRPTGLRHHLYGSTEQVLQRMERTLVAEYPGARIVGREAPPFRPLDRAEHLAAARRIERSRADVVWVGLGTPRQDDTVHLLRAWLPVTLVAVGAAFDFIAGTRPQAPVWMQTRGLEWLYRLGAEPRRLWRRYLFGNSRFLWTVARQPPRRIIDLTEPSRPGERPEGDRRVSQERVTRSSGPGAGPG
jgi:N-acetylglucosaminyldiphosphoundecaprenol N-acetyl-beta-D-mannosaminyltransferase